MAIQIKGAPKPGWYFPVSENMLAPYLWGGAAEYVGEKMVGYLAGIYFHDNGPQIYPAWFPAKYVVGLGNETRYRFMETPPDTWRSKDIREVVKDCESKILQPPPARTPAL